MAFITSLPLTAQRRLAHKQTCLLRPARIAPRASAGGEVDPGSRHMLDTLEIPPRVALTREVGKNEALSEAMHRIYSFIEVMQLPCVRTVALPGAMELSERLRRYASGEADEIFEWVVVTSPEGASFFLDSWRQAGCPTLPRIAAVGRATGDCLRAVGLDVTFEPSKATGRCLVAEFPAVQGGQGRILYPVSRKAKNEVFDGLGEKGFAVERINTYSSEVNVFDKASLVLAEGVHIVTFASPSAVKGWVDNVGVGTDIIVACIGETSAKAAREAGFRHVHYPDAPGIDGWMTAVCEAMKVFERMKKKAGGKKQ